MTVLIPEDQLEMVTRYISRTDFINAFLERYATKANMSTMWSRASNLWYRRDKIKANIEKKKEEDRKLMIPISIRNKASAPDVRAGKGDPLPDVGELIARQNNILAELLQVAKESLALQRKQTELFETLRWEETMKSKTKHIIIPCIFTTLRNCNHAFVNMESGEVWCSGWKRNAGSKKVVRECEA